MHDARAISTAYNEAFNAHDEERLRSLFAGDAIFTAPGGVRLEGPEAIVGYIMAWLRAFPDARETIDNELIVNDWAIAQSTYKGTHTDTLIGPAGEIPATGKTAVGRGAEFIRVENGKIAEGHLYFDQMEILTQLGLVPEPAATPA